MEYNENIPENHRPVYAWGHKHMPKQKGIVSFSVSPNRQRPLAHAAHNAIFNTFRRSRNQFLYVVPPFVVAYMAMTWAEEKNEYYNSKPGRALQAVENVDVGSGSG